MFGGSKPPPESKGLFGATKPQEKTFVAVAPVSSIPSLSGMGGGFGTSSLPLKSGPGSFGAPSGSMFGNKDKPAPASSLFGSKPSQPATGSMFGSKPSTEPAKNLFGKKEEPSEKKPGAPSAFGQPSGGLFDKKPSGNPSSLFGA